ncbi:MAG: hypothetical protein ACREFR_16350, partial [Limisphaerales bacterium]
MAARFPLYITLMLHRAVSVGCRISGKIHHAVFLASFLLAGHALAANLLSNPGFETGDLGGWT